MKYKAFEVKTKKWFNWNQILNNFEHFYFGDKYILVQYTGLKDKNGNKIYEGDIVEYPQNFNEDELFKNDPKSVGEIKYLDEYGCFDIVGWFGGCNLANNITVIKVIGNIHENKELIK